MKMFEDVRRNLQSTSELRKLEYTFAQALWPVPGFLD